MTSTWKRLSNPLMESQILKGLSTGRPKTKAVLRNTRRTTLVRLILTSFKCQPLSTIQKMTQLSTKVVLASKTHDLMIISSLPATSMALTYVISNTSSQSSNISQNQLSSSLIISSTLRYIYHLITYSAEIRIRPLFQL